MESFNFNDNFWEVHPGLAAAGPFKRLHASDKSRNKVNSSKLAWCVKLIWDRKSDYYSLPETGENNKLELIFGDHYGDAGYYTKNKGKVEELRDFYITSKDTVAIRTLRGIEEKLTERAAFLRNTPYDNGDETGLEDVGFSVADWAKRIDTIDKMMANTDKLYTLYDKARKAVEQEEQITAIGGAQESLSDSNRI
jgi:hypothetical protein